MIALEQLVALGLSPSGVRKRAASGRLHRIHRGVYAVGHTRLTREGRWLAAVLACGPGAALSHRSAAALWGLRPNGRAVVDVSSPHRAGRAREGIDVHRGASLDTGDRTTIDAIPATSLARTLLDLAAVVSLRELERACDQAEVLRLFDLRALEDVLERSATRRGAAALNAVLAAEPAATTLTRSELEERFLALCRAMELPQPQVNAWVALDGGGVEADFLWREQRLIAETDGIHTHGTPQAFERDRRRDQRLLLAGWRVVRFTWRQVVENAGETCATLRTLLAPAVSSRGSDRAPAPRRARA